MKLSNLLSAVVMLAALSLSSCRKNVDPIPEVPTPPTACAGTDVAANSWAVIGDDGKTTLITVTDAELYNTKTTDDRIQYSFSGTTSTLGDAISFTFKGENPPATGTYALAGSDQNIGAKDVYSLGIGGGTATMGGGLFPVSGNVAVTNNDGAISIEGKGMKYKTALGKALCVSFKLNYNKKPSTNPGTDPAGNLSTYTTKYFYPDHIATDDKGNVYTTGLLNGKQLQKFDAKGELVTAYAATDFGLAATEQPYIVGVCNDKTGNVWVLTVIANKPSRLYKISSGGQPVLDRSIDNTKSSLKTIAVPDMEISSTGEVYYIVETDNSLVKKIDKNGLETTFIGATNTNPFALTNNNVNLTDLTFDGADNLYISMNNSAFTYFGIYKYAGGVQSKLYGSTTRGPEAVVNGTFSTGSFRTLQSLAVSSDGKTLYAGDGNYLRKITLADDKITTVAGNGQQSSITYMYNGPALTGRTLPVKLTFSPDQKNIIINSYGVLEKFTL